MEERKHRLAMRLSAMALASAVCWVCAWEPAFPKTESRMMNEEALHLGQQFGVVVGEVNEEIRAMLGLQRAEGVVVFEVIAGRPAELAGIEAKSIIKEIDKVEIKTLDDFGRALKTAMPTENFSVATYEPTDPDNQGLSGGINFHFVRVAKD